MRSRTTQAWLKEQGIDYPLIKGGYKAMRSFLIEQLSISANELPLVILGGLTGSGKTRVLKKTRFHIDLEGIANHRGSAFGRDVNDFQPTPINWENSLSIACLKYRHQHPGAGVLLEDEGKMIGRVIIPAEFYDKMLSAPRVILQRDLAERIDIIREDYIEHNWPAYQQQHGTEAEDKFSSFVLDNLARIKNRLGGERYRDLHQQFSGALATLFASGETERFNDGIRQLLTDYYDPMYNYQLEKKQVEILFQGSEDEIIDWVDANLENYPR